jgi:hypothetical protein
MLPLFLLDPSGQSCPATILAVHSSVVNLTWLRPHILVHLLRVENICLTNYLHFLMELTLVDTGKGGSVKGCLGPASEWLAERCSPRSRRVGYHR